MKKILAVCLTAVLLFLPVLPAFAAPLYNDEVETTSEIIFLRSVDDGTVLFDKNSTMRCPPAGLLNIVTAMIVLNNVEDPQTQYFTVPDSINNILAGTDSAVMLLKGGEKVRVIDLLYSILIRSAADSSITLATGVGGTLLNFINMMNDYVRELGCSDTNFVNVTGLDVEGQYTTARDMAIVMQEASQNKLFREITMSGTYDFPATELYGERRVYTTNLMIQPGFPSYYCKSVTAVKSGATSGAGRCVALTASKDGYTYVAVVMKGQYIDTDGNGEKENFAFLDCKAMLNWTFDTIRLRTVTDDTQTVGEIPVRYSFKTDHVRLVPAKKLAVLMPQTVDTGSVVFEVIPEQTAEFLKAPVKKGEVVGAARVMFGEQEIAVVELAAGEDVSFDLTGFVAGVLKDVFTNPIVLLILFVLIAVAVVYFVLGVRYDKKMGRFRVMRGGNKNARETGTKR